FFSSRRRHTSWPRDWSSDVCSSDLRLAYERLEDLVGVADVRSNLGMIYRRLGRWDDSIGEYGASLAIRERTGHLRGIAASHNNLGEVYRSRGEPAQAIPHYLQAIALLESAGGAADAA